MKAFLFLFTLALGLGLTIAGLYLTGSKPSRTAHDTSVPTIATAAGPNNGSRENPRPPAARSAVTMAASPNDAVTGAEPKIITQDATDFATGKAYNLIAKETSLRLAPDAPVFPGLGQAVGLYVSPVREIRTPKQQQDEAFDMILFDYDLAATADSFVKFEFRTIAVDEEGEGWSAWREITPENRNTPITLERTAEKWQYRVALAHDPGGSSEIRNITVFTLQDPVKASRLFTHGTP